MANRPCKDPSLFHLYKNFGKYAAWVRRPSQGNERHYIGCYATFHMAARSQDRALLYINRSAAVNFKAADYDDDEELRSTLDEKAFLRMLRDESRPVYKVVATKSQCFLKFQRMEEDIEELRRVTKFTIREFVAHLTENPSPNPEVNEAAQTLLEIFGTHTVGNDVAKLLAPTRASDVPLEIFGAQVAVQMEDSNALHIPLFIPKGKRSPRTSRNRAADGAGPSSEEINRPRTRAACKRKLATTSYCPFSRPRS